MCLLYISWEIKKKKSLEIPPPRDMNNDHEHFEIFQFSRIPVFI